MIFIQARRGLLRFPPEKKDYPSRIRRVWRLVEARVANSETKMYKSDPGILIVFCQQQTHSLTPSCSSPLTTPHVTAIYTAAAAAPKILNYSLASSLPSPPPPPPRWPDNHRWIHFWPLSERPRPAGAYVLGFVSLIGPLWPCIHTEQAKGGGAGD